MSGCGTVFAVLLVVGLVAAYWYIAVPLAVLVAGGAAYWYYRREQQLPQPKSGRQDGALDQITGQLRRFGLVEQTRNTGQHLEGVPMEGDVCADAEDMRLFVNVFASPSFASSVAAKLKTRPDVQAALARGESAVVARGSLLYVANGRGRRLDEQRFQDIVREVSLIEAPQGAVENRAAELSASGPDALDQIRRLGELRDAGIISNEEFAAKKADLLKRL